MATKELKAKMTNKEPLDKPVSASKLKEFAKIFKDVNIDDLETIEITALQDLRNEYDQIVDPRVPEQVHFILSETVLIVLLGVLSNCNEWEEIKLFADAHEAWLKKFLKLEYGIPSIRTMQRVMESIDEQMLEEISLNYFLKFVQMATANSKAEVAAFKENDKIEQNGITRVNEIDDWLKAAESGQTDKNIDILAFDGKVSKSSKRKETDQSPEHRMLDTLSAYSVSLGSCLRSEFIPQKANEITSMPSLLNKIGIAGAVVTCDALNTQTGIVKLIIERGADYVMPVKGNKKTLYGDFQTIFDEPTLERIREQNDNSQYLRTQKREQGTMVIREYFLITDFDGLYKADEWDGLKAIGLARRTVVTVDPKTKETITTYEDRYYISSLVSIIHFAQSVRGHWNIENSLHWQLDYTFKDDSNKTTAENGAKGLQIIKKLSLTILKVLQAVSPPRTSLKSLRFVLSMLFEKKIAVLLNLFNADVIDRVGSLVQNKI